MTDMKWAFSEATAFNVNIGNWNVGKTKDMYGTFYKATSFNSNLGSWDTSSVTDMSTMFQSATAFTGAGIGNWNVGSVGHFEFM